MTFVALKMIFGDRLKFLGLLVGLTFAATLITQQMAIFLGYTTRIYAFVNDTAYADLWVMDPQVAFTEDFQPIPDTRLWRTRGVEGVAWAMPMYRAALPVRLNDGTRVISTIVGIDDGSLAGGPPEMIEGRLEDLRLSDGIIVDEAAANGQLAVSDGQGNTRPLRVGDEVSINDQTGRVVGICRINTPFFWQPVIYTTYSRALRFAPPQRNQLQYILVKAQPGEDLDALARRIEARTELSALNRAEFTALTTWYVLKQTGILVNFGITVALGFIIGMLSAGQTFYNFVLDNVRYFGALKALGAGNLRLLGMLAVQVVAVGLLGWGLGVGLASISGAALKGIGLGFYLPAELLFGSAASILLICMLAACLSATRVFRLEPAVVFKS